jgi:hypothetical protein
MRDLVRNHAIVFALGLAFGLLLRVTGGCPGIEPVQPDPKPCDGCMPPVTPPSPLGACQEACLHRQDMHCGGDTNCVETCERYEAEARDAPAMAWNPVCQTRAATCKAADACRGH